MKRRDFLFNSMILGTAGLLQPTGKIYGAVEGGYTGRLLVHIQADGAWDVSSFCDPKVNQPGELVINNWASSGEIQQAGNIQYAPFAGNQAFFEKYFQDMLVINGVDYQTNSHTTGIVHSWSGRSSSGFPTLTSMFAAHQAPDQPLSYLNFGGYSETASLIRFSRLGALHELTQILDPADQTFGGEQVVRSRRATDIARIRSYADARAARLLAKDQLTPRQRDRIEATSQAFKNRSSLTEFLDYLPSEVSGEEFVNSRTTNRLKREIEMTMAAFDAGIASAVDFYAPGFDTHQDHDSLHEPLLSNLTESIDLLWTLAEEKNLADRMTVVIGSDFSRTPHYNADNGKDHWPIGSVIVMEKDASWTNRMVGLTDEGQNAYNINPSSLEVDDNNGTIIYPKHVHKALRRYLGLENTTVESSFQFVNTEDFAFFT